MRTLKILLGLIFLIVLSSGVLGAFEDSNLHYYRFENNLNDSVNTSAFRLSNTSPIKFVAGKQLIGANITSEALSPVGVNLDALTTVKWTVRCWVNPTLITSNRAIFGDWNDPTGWFIRISSGNYQFRENCGAQQDENFAAATANVFAYVAITYDGSQYKLFHNGNTSTDHNRQACGDNGVDFKFTNIASVGAFIGIVDECSIWGRNLSKLEIGQDYNAGAGLFFPFQQNHTLNISLPSVANGTQFGILNGSTIDINVTVNSSTSFNCSFFIDGDLNDTINNTGAGKDIGINFTNTYPDGNYTYSISCENTNHTKFTTSNIFFVDTVAPAFVTNYINNSIFFRANLVAQFNLSDDTLLSSYNLTINNNNINGSDNIDAATFNATINFNLTSLLLPTGSHIMTLRVADGHTAKELRKDYDFDNGVFNDYSKYTFDEGGFIKTESKSKSILDSWSSEKNVDRYTQIYIPATPSASITFIEESDLPIKIAHHPTKYKGEWIIIGDHWKDYVLKGEPESTVSIKRITDYKVEVTVANIKNNPNRLEFESIGDLNVVFTNFSVFIVNGSASSPAFVTEREQQGFNLSINTTTNMTTAAAFFYNGTQQTVTKTSFGTFDFYESKFFTPSSGNLTTQIPWRWGFNVTGFTNETGNITGLVTQQQILLTNCTANATNKTLRFTMRNEETEAEMNATLNANIVVWVDGHTTQTKTFDITYAANITHEVCIYPSSKTLTANYVLTYNADGFDQRQTISNNQILSNQTQEINLYLLSSTTSINAFIKAVDVAQNPISGVNVQMSTVLGGVNVTLQEQTTDDSGLSTFSINPNTDYFFTLSKDGLTTVTKQFRPSSGQIITIVMGAPSGVQPSGTGIGISYSFQPKNATIANNTDIDFTFNMTSTFWNISNCTLFIKNSTGAILASSSSTFNGSNCDISITQNTGDLTFIRSEAQYTLNGTISDRQFRDYRVGDVFQGEFSIKTLFQDISNFTGAGFNDFTRMIIALIAIFAIIVAAATGLSITDQDALIFLFVALVWLFSTVGFFTISADLPGDFPSLQKYFIAVLCLLAGAGLMLWRRI